MRRGRNCVTCLNFRQLEYGGLFKPYMYKLTFCYSVITFESIYEHKKKLQINKAKMANHLFYNQKKKIVNTIYNN